MSQKAAAAKTTETKSNAQPARNGKAEARPQVASGEQVLALQRAYGNRAVQRLFASGRLQRALAGEKPARRNNHASGTAAGGILRMGANLLRRKEEKEEELREQEATEEEPVQGFFLQRSEEKDEIRKQESEKEDIVQKQEKKEEEPAQPKPVQRQEDEEKEIRTQPDKDEDIQQQKAVEEEGAVQGEFLLRQAVGEEEEIPQAKPVQRQEEEEAQEKPEEEETAQAKVQRKEEDKDAPASLQAKLRIGPANDRYEQEADRMAERVLSMPAQAAAEKGGAASPPLRRKALASAITPFMRRQPAGEGAGRSAPPEVANKIAASRGLGSPMPEGLQQYMGSRFGTDFSGVRLHTDANADTLNRSVKAQAFTVGSDVYFAQGRYNPDSYDGKHLVAHELTHVVQQGGAAAAQAMPLSRAQRSIQRLSVKGVINSVLSYIPGFTLLTVILGENPVTGDKVPQTGKNLLKGAMELIPVVGPLLYGQLEETGAADKAGAWLDGEMKQLNLTVPQIKKLIEIAWDRVSIFKGISGNKEVIQEVFGPVLGRIVQLVQAVKGKVQELVLEGALMMAGAASRQVMEVLRKNRAALLKIIENPAIIITNFFKAVRLGFENFKDNFGMHFKTAAMEWLFGAVADAGIELPKKFDLPGIFSLVMQVLGLTYKNIRARLVAGIAQVYGEEKAEKAVSMIEKGFAFIQRIITEGPIAIWEWIKESLADLKEKVIDGILTWVRNTIIMKAIMKLVSMLNPVGALVQAAIAIYDVIVFFIENWQRIQAVVSAIFSAIANVAMGQLTEAAGFIEKTMAKGMTMLLSFLARLIGLGGISKKVREIIEKIQKPINAAIEKFVTFVVKKAKPIMDKIAGGVRKLKEKGKAAVKKGVAKIKELIFPTVKFKVGTESHSVKATKKGEKHSILINSPSYKIDEFIATYQNEKGVKEGKLSELRTNYDKWEKMPEKDDNEKRKKEKKYSPIAKLIISIMQSQKDVPETEIKKESEPTFDGKSKRATRVIADPLTNKGEKGSSTTASVKVPGIDTEYESASYKVHLLHAGLPFGKAEPWNLTAASKTINERLRGSVERFELSAVKQNKVITHDINVTYESDPKPEWKRDVAKSIKAVARDKETGAVIGSFSGDNYS